MNLYTIQAFGNGILLIETNLHQLELFWNGSQKGTGGFRSDRMK